MQAKELIEFDEEIATAFNNKEIRAPIHLHGNNENQLIKIFESISPSDWIFSSWRSHYHCLLKGVPRDQLKNPMFQKYIISKRKMNKKTKLIDIDSFEDFSL